MAGFKKASFNNLTPELQDKLSQLASGGFMKKDLEEEARQRQNFAETPLDQDFFNSLMKPVSQEVSSSQSQSKEMPPIVKDYLSKKIAEKKEQASAPQREPAVNSPVAAQPEQKQASFMDKFSDEERQKALDASYEGNGAMAIAQFFGGLGDTLAGRNPAETAKAFANYRAQQKDNNLGEFDRSKDSAVKDYNTNRSIEQNQMTDAQRARDMDVNSEESKMARQLAIKMGMNPEAAKNLTAAKFKETSSVLEKMYAVDQARLARQDAQSVKASEKSDKRKQTMYEIEDRRQNINAALDTLDNMIKEDGTYEAIGSHNQDMERLIEQVATDMAKLQDPNSVARPSEVESVKQNLIRSGFKNSNSTAREILKNFRGEVERRADSAYKVRGLESPVQQSSNSDPRVDAFMKKNGITDRNEAIKILKENGKL